MGYNNIGKLDGDYFRIWKNNKGGVELEFYIDRIEFKDYYIYKKSNKFKEVSVEDFKEFKYSAYIFFNKDLYNNIEIDKSIEWLYNNNNMYPQFLDKPLPRLENLKKIKTIKNK
jgi:hypothetical protein